MYNNCAIISIMVLVVFMFLVLPVIFMSLVPLVPLVPFLPGSTGRFTGRNLRFRSAASNAGVSCSPYRVASSLSPLAAPASAVAAPGSSTIVPSSVGRSVARTRLPRTPPGNGRSDTARAASVGMRAWTKRLLNRSP